MDCAIRDDDSQEILELEELNRKVSQRLAAAAADADKRREEESANRWVQSVMRRAHHENVQRQRRQEWKQIGKIAQLVAVALVAHHGRITGCIIPEFALLVQIVLLACCFLHVGRFCEIRKHYTK